MNEYKDLLLYWIRERYNIHLYKTLTGRGKPWSNDPVFQTTYFCNVHRENDKVTQWIRKELSPFEVGSVNYEFVMVLARFLNWPDTLAYLKDPVIRARPSMAAMPEFTKEWCAYLKQWLERRAESGEKVWGNAYVITSHGMKMSKIDYLCSHLLPDVLRALPAIQVACGVRVEEIQRPVEEAKAGPPTLVPPTCRAAANALQQVQGIGSFLAGQIVADLKNTVDYPLYYASDKKTFVVPGPGSVRGLNWFLWGSETGGITERNFDRCFPLVRKWVDAAKLDIPYIDNQDLQNCLCEFDKYCRVKTGKGRSKRNYQGV